jgi:hypothetical protein
MIEIPFMTVRLFGNPSLLLLLILLHLFTCSLCEQKQGEGFVLTTMMRLDVTQRAAKAMNGNGKHPLS